MSFRSRSRNIQPIVTRPRSHSSSRVGSNGTSNSYLSSPSYTSSPSSSSSQHSNAHRSIGGSAYFPSSTNSPGYQSAYGGSNSYGSRDVLYSPTGRNGFFNSRDPYGSTSSLNTLKSSNGSGGKYGGSVNSIYSSSPSHYNYDTRSSYPYSSHFDNGVTTASLNIPFTPKQKNDYTKSPNMYHKSINSYTPASSSTNGSSSRVRDYTPSRNPSNLLNTREFSGSNPTLNCYNPSQLPSQVGRSQSLRDHERKSRTRNRRNKAANGATGRALSVTSEKSDGYEVRLKF